MAKSTLLNMFARSPLRPLKQHMAKADLCVQTLKAFLEAATKGDWAEAEKVQQQIARYEDEADAMKIDLRLHLPKGLFMPVSRSDLLALLSRQERMANKAKDISGLMIGRHMVIPAELATDFLEFLQSSIDTSAQAKKAIDELDELMETGFVNKEVSLVESMVEQLDRLEDETDEHERVLRKKLFEMEESLPPVHVMFLYKIIDDIGELADDAEAVGSRLQMLLAK